MLTPEDLRDRRRTTGFKYVNTVDHPDQRQKKPYRAEKRLRAGGKAGNFWRGQRRATAVEAAQDYCDFVNGTLSAALASLPSYAAPVIDMGGSKRLAPVPEKVTVKRERYIGPHDLYDVLLISPNGEVVSRKVGITARGKLRYADLCTTFGFSIKPVSKAKTYPSKAAALEAEAAKVAAVCSDPAWRRVGKEAFAPQVVE